MSVTSIILTVIYSILSTFSLLLFVMAICSWFPQARQSKFYMVMDKIVSPLLRPIRSLLNRSQMIRNCRIDLSFLALVLIVSLAERLIYYLI